MYTLLKIFNNNVVLAKDISNKEYVFMGKGIGYKKSKGEILDENYIEKRFDLMLSSHSDFDAYYDVISKIVQNSENIIGDKLNDYIYYSLSDHLDFALERLSDGITFRSPIQWELSKAYPKEFKAALEALDIIEDKLSVRLPKEEAAALALHIINARNEVNEFDDLFEELTLIEDVIRIIKLHFKINIDTESANYERFLIHLKFFVHRLRGNAQLDSKQEAMFLMMAHENPEVYECSLKIRKLFYNKKDILVLDEELFYLMLHIERLVDRSTRGD